MNRMRQAVLAITMLACCLSGLPSAAQAQKAVGAVTQPQLAAEAATARANEGAALRPQTSVTARAPTFADDNTTGQRIGSTWLTDDLYTNLSATPGTAVWLLTPNHALPGDQIGLHLTGAALSAAGTGYAIGDTLTLPGGAVLTVATITGGAATGPIGSTTITNPAYHACFNNASGGLGQIGTSGGGTGATFTGSFIGPYLYGARLLTVCYRANKALDLAGAPGTMTIGFAPGGLIDYATIDAAFPGVRPQLVTLYDQGINGANGAQQPAYAGTISPLRTVHGVRTLLMDGDRQGPLDSGAINNITSVNLPAGVTASNQAVSLIFAGGVQSLDRETGLVNVGNLLPNTSTSLTNKAQSTNIGLSDGGSGGVACPGQPWDRDNVVFGINTATSGTCILNGVTGTAGGAPAAATDSGGVLGYTYDGGGYAFVDYDMAAIVPWSLSQATEVPAIDASIQSTFGIQRQPRSVMVFDGDSIPDAHGAPAQHGFVRMVSDMLARPDIKIVNTSYFGSTMSGGASNGAPGSRLTEQPLNVLPVLDAAYAANAPNILDVLSPMGNNDFQRGDTLATVETAYQTYCANVHTHHGKCVLTYFTNSTVGQYGSANYIALAQWISANTAGTGPGADIVIPIPPCPSGVACYQSDNLHPAPPNNYIMARAVLNALAPALH